ncbi:Aldo keto reductase [Mycena amicta]|nr:Aldo keto reductase [Mycena amicta]
MPSTPTPTRTLGDATFGAIGFGAMGISIAYGAVGSDEERFKILDAAHAAGCTFWDTAQIYNDSEELLGKCAAENAQTFSSQTKCGFNPDLTLNGSPENVHRTADESLRKLGVDQIDLFYLHRADSSIPIERTVGAMAELVKAGKVKHLGLSEVSASTLRRAHAVHPIAALQVEYSPFTLDIEDPKIDLLRTARELGVKIVAYSPLGRGLLTGQYRSPNDFEAADFRRMVPRYSEANFPYILRLADGLKAIGAKYTTSAVALAWLLAQGDDIIPIPGTKKTKYLTENILAGSVTLSPDDVAAVQELAVEADKAGATAGPRYPEVMWAQMFVDTPAL